MAEIKKKPIKITETILRDAHQSLIATRMTTEQMLPIVDKMDKVGYHSVECWGGATFDASLRFLKEDPWERLRLIRQKCKKTKLQMLFRGQNILGYKHYADDVVEKFVQKSIENGIDIIRVFDALNDVRNLKSAVEATKKYGGHCQIALSYTTSPVHTVEYYVELAKEVKRLQELGCHVILTNSNHPLVHELYADYKIEVIQTKRYISCNGSKRKGEDIIVDILPKQKTIKHEK